MRSDVLPPKGRSGVNYVTLPSLLSGIGSGRIDPALTSHKLSVASPETSANTSLRWVELLDVLSGRPPSYLAVLRKRLPGRLGFASNCSLLVRNSASWSAATTAVLLCWRASSTSLRRCSASVVASTAAATLLSSLLPIIKLRSPVGPTIAKASPIADSSQTHTRSSSCNSRSILNMRSSYTSPVSGWPHSLSS